MERFIFAEDPDKIPAPAARFHRERVVPANTGADRIDGTAVVLQEYAGMFRPGGIQHHNRKILCEHDRMGVFQVKSAGIHFRMSIIPQVLCDPVSVQTLHHNRVLNIAAALTAPLAAEVDPVLCANRPYLIW